MPTGHAGACLLPVDEGLDEPYIIVKQCTPTEDGVARTVDGGRGDQVIGKGQNEEAGRTEAVTHNSQVCGVGAVAPVLLRKRDALQRGVELSAW